MDNGNVNSRLGLVKNWKTVRWSSSCACSEHVERRFFLLADEIVRSGLLSLLVHAAQHQQI
jgi:hypothetical protein